MEPITIAEEQKAELIYNMLRPNYRTFRDFFESLDKNEQNYFHKVCFNHQIEDIQQDIKAIKKIVDKLETKHFPESMTIPEAADFLNISVSKLRKLCECGDIQFIQTKKSGKIIIEKADLEKWIENNKK